MMSDDDKRGPGFHKAPPGAIPPYQAARGQFRDPARQAQIEMVTGGNDLEWDRWRATIEYGRGDGFANLLDFFVNPPSLQEKFADPTVTNGWYWREVERVTLARHFGHRPELLPLLRSHAGPDALIQAGWLVNYVTGRIDTETT
jgi:hypothetical protein